MAYPKLQGIYSALLTSFNHDGTINEKGVRELVRYNIDVNKVDGLYVGGSTGENFMLGTQEKEEIFKIVKDEAKDQIKLIAQVGSLNIKESVHLAKFATDLGYDSLSAVTPFYYKFSFAEVKDYYNTIIENVDNQMIVYFIPFLTGVNISIEQFGELFANEKITGCKFTAGDFYLLERFRKAFPDKALFAGFDEMMLPATVLGVDGAIGSTFNVNGVRARQIFDFAREGKIKEALDVQHVTNDFITDVLKNGLYGTLKICLQEAGVDAGYCRKPMGDYSDEMIENAKKIYHKYF
ncbi:N-acetylneuraminate lyase [Anaerobiospirillum thomasii]|uniref:N-acetylneuraminate lyase n=1 Tax=Anaerobiospirillum thomasii TaxID=179995 RepID=A0A2X0WMN0_9GAMM|nr:N-acetylneuraminate lyase [Anaerobiospirillum thomasii]SPT69742.1 N-acetylneuraminate lyase [Anaerobiospirillum thomasii]SPT71707.1 N-acetylneuraminate lyase [Anaerobiospirillum thomasii]